MATALMTAGAKKKLASFLKKHKRCDLLSAYLFFLEQRYGFHPVLFPMGKVIYRSKEDAIERLEKEGKLWREAQIRVSFSKEAVNEGTKKIYICPFSGKVFGDNTHPNPQDAIYDWVSHCPENTERIGGLHYKRVFVSEDPEVIKNYIKPRKEPVTKRVFSSAISGKLFNSKRAVIDDFTSHYLKPMTLNKAQSQSRFELEPEFLSFLEEQLDETKVTAFVGKLAEDEEFASAIQHWLE